MLKNKLETIQVSKTSAAVALARRVAMEPECLRASVSSSVNEAGGLDELSHVTLTVRASKPVSGLHCLPGPEYCSHCMSLGSQD